MDDIVEWTTYIILAGFAITVWALVANNKKRKKLVIYKYKNVRYWPKAVIQHYFIIHQLEVVISSINYLKNYLSDNILILNSA